MVEAFRAIRSASTPPVDGTRIDGNPSTLPVDDTGNDGNPSTTRVGVFQNVGNASTTRVDAIRTIRPPSTTGVGGRRTDRTPSTTEVEGNGTVRETRRLMAFRLNSSPGPPASLPARRYESDERRERDARRPPTSRFDFGAPALRASNDLWNRGQAQESRSRRRVACPRCGTTTSTNSSSVRFSPETCDSGVSTAIGPRYDCSSTPRIARSCACSASVRSSKAGPDGAQAFDLKAGAAASIFSSSGYHKRTPSCCGRTRQWTARSISTDSTRCRIVYWRRSPAP